MHANLEQGLYDTAISSTTLTLSAAEQTARAEAMSTTNLRNIADPFILAKHRVGLGTQLGEFLRQEAQNVAGRRLTIQWQ